MQLKQFLDRLDGQDIGSLEPRIKVAVTLVNEPDEPRTVRGDLRDIIGGSLLIDDHVPFNPAEILDIKIIDPKVQLMPS